MRRTLASLLLGLMISAHVGCILPIYSGDPARRSEQLLYTSENLRQFVNEWERIWFLDMPDQMSPERTHGGIL